MTDVLERIGIDVLTAREREIARLVALGMRAKQIAEQLGIATPTVNKHIEHIKNKLHLRSRATNFAARIARLYALQEKSNFRRIESEKE